VLLDCALIENRSFLTSKNSGSQFNRSIDPEYHVRAALQENPKSKIPNLKFPVTIQPQRAFLSTDSTDYADYQ
jgi:hypothetical protein